VEVLFMQGIKTLLESREFSQYFIDFHAGNLELSNNSLTNREVEIVKLVANGQSSREISGTLFISKRTVENHRIKIMRKLKLKKYHDLVRYAIQKGYTNIDIDP